MRRDLSGFSAQDLFWFWIQIRITESTIFEEQDISNLAKPLWWHRTFAWWHNVWPRWVPVERWSCMGSMAVVVGPGVSFSNVEPGYGSASKWSVFGELILGHTCTGYLFLKIKLQMHWMEATSKIGFCSKNRTGEVVAQHESRPKLLEQWSIGKVEDGDDVLHVRSLPGIKFPT